ncbi:hypothetical protein GMRT_10875 [Giardia muris]|uniref:Uncharacterized protein n=1 Tax=Giardia muris TaxID=5742 RepID=A0A4Z1T3Q5_GIAMU|nr:hypothetical protein GMRT_10875 [Giardia muris]|eukprot:TNJ28613.1 hypothetical protein GMRT_10875 [Giardia muris]
MLGRAPPAASTCTTLRAILETGEGRERALREPASFFQQMRMPGAVCELAEMIYAARFPENPLRTVELLPLSHPDLAQSATHLIRAAWTMSDTALGPDGPKALGTLMLRVLEGIAEELPAEGTCAQRQQVYGREAERLHVWTDLLTTILQTEAGRIVVLGAMTERYGTLEIADPFLRMLDLDPLRQLYQLACFGEDVVTPKERKAAQQYLIRTRVISRLVTMLLTNEQRMEHSPSLPAPYYHGPSIEAVTELLIDCALSYDPSIVEELAQHLPLFASLLFIPEHALSASLPQLSYLSDLLVACLSAILKLSRLGPDMTSDVILPVEMGEKVQHEPLLEELLAIYGQAIDSPEVLDEHPEYIVPYTSYVSLIGIDCLVPFYCLARMLRNFFRVHLQELLDLIVDGSVSARFIIIMKTIARILNIPNSINIIICARRTGQLPSAVEARGIFSVEDLNHARNYHEQLPIFGMLAHECDGFVRYEESYLLQGYGLPLSPLAFFTGLVSDKKVGTQPAQYLMLTLLGNRTERLDLLRAYSTRVLMSLLALCYPSRSLRRWFIDTLYVLELVQPLTASSRHPHYRAICLATLRAVLHISDERWLRQREELSKGPSTLEIAPKHGRSAVHHCPHLARGLQTFLRLFSMELTIESDGKNDRPK